MSRVKVNSAYVLRCIDAVKLSELSETKRNTIVKILTEYYENKAGEKNDDR